MYFFHYKWISADCAYTYHLRNCNLKWLPECDNKNKFVAKQCKGDKLTGR